MATRRLIEGQRAVVTGASSGIGAAVACALGEAGAAVIVNYHSDEQGAQATVATIATAGGKAVPVQADVSRAEDCARLFDVASDHFGG
jgi:glucose 1-dehydrogenase